MILIVSCCNQNGGLLIVDTDGAEVKYINEMDCRGVVYYQQECIFFLTRKGLWRKPPGGDAKLISDICNDWHGLIAHDGRLWGVDPVSDTIVEWDVTGKFICRWHWKNENQAGSRFHTNDIAVDKGTLWQCCFAQGICRDGEPMGWGAHRQPHSLAFHPSHLTPYWCASNRGQVFHGNRFVAEWPEAFTRGLLYTPDGLIVGLSAQRAGSGGTKAQLKHIDFNGNELWTIDLPTNEVYAIARVQGT
jgi:hypothetical protein